MKYTHRLADHNKVTQQELFVETAHRKSKGVLNFENYFPPQPKNIHNCTTALYTKYVRNTKNYFPSEPKNSNNATTVLYSKYGSM
jgi:hypothetical protein